MSEGEISEESPHLFTDFSFKPIKTIINSSIINQNLGQVTEQVTEQATEQATEPATEQATEPATGQETKKTTGQISMNEIINFCKNPKTTKEIMEFAGIKHREYFRSEILKPLLDKKFLKMTVPEKPNSPNQKYLSTTI